MKAKKFRKELRREVARLNIEKYVEKRLKPKPKYFPQLIWGWLRKLFVYEKE